MDFSALVKTLVTDKTVNEVSKKSGASKKDVSSVLTTALPLLLSNSNTSAATVAQTSGVSQATTNSVLTTAAPLLLGSLGGQNNAQQSTAATNIALISAVLGKLDLSKLTSGLMNLVSTNTAAPAQEAEASEKPASGKKPAAKKGYTSYTGATKEYVVKNGDTLGSIAYGNGINIRQLKALNNLTSDSLKIGQKLKIPAEKVVTAKKSAPVKEEKVVAAAEVKKPAEVVEEQKPE